MRDDTDSIDIDLIAGARPNFIKLAAIVRGLLALRDRNPDPQLPRFRIIHTGQHHDQRMSGHFFKQLGIPEPLPSYVRLRRLDLVAPSKDLPRRW